jgi:hypothetical protein
MVDEFIRGACSWRRHFVAATKNPAGAPRSHLGALVADSGPSALAAACDAEEGQGAGFRRMDQILVKPLIESRQVTTIQEGTGVRQGVSEAVASGSGVGFEPGGNATERSAEAKPIVWTARGLLPPSGVSPLAGRCVNQPPSFRASPRWRFQFWEALPNSSGRPERLPPVILRSATSCLLMGNWGGLGS